jgi:hypothetical protein
MDGRHQAVLPARRPVLQCKVEAFARFVTRGPPFIEPPDRRILPSKPVNKALKRFKY